MEKQGEQEEVPQEVRAGTTAMAAMRTTGHSSQAKGKTHVIKALSSHHTSNAREK